VYTSRYGDCSVGLVLTIKKASKVSFLEEHLLADASFSGLFTMKYQGDVSSCPSSLPSVHYHRINSQSLFWKSDPIGKLACKNKDWVVGLCYHSRDAQCRKILTLQFACCSHAISLQIDYYREEGAPEAIISSPMWRWWTVHVEGSGCKTKRFWTSRFGTNRWALRLSYPTLSDINLNPTLAMPCHWRRLFFIIISIFILSIAWINHHLSNCRATESKEVCVKKSNWVC